MVYLKRLQNVTSNETPIHKPIPEVLKMEYVIQYFYEVLLFWPTMNDNIEYKFATRHTYYVVHT